MNSTADLYTPDFPHGTPNGYEQGCRGGACPNRGSAELQTCKEAHARYQRDPDYKRLVKSAATLERLAAKEGGVGMLPTPPARPKPQIFPPLSVTLPIVEAPRTEQLQDTPTAPTVRKGKLPLDHPDFPHGTTGGFSRGCKDESACPHTPSCRQSVRDYQRDWHAQKKTSPGEGSAPTPNVPAERKNQARETGGTTPAETEATIRTPEPSTVNHTPPTPDEPEPIYSHGGEPDGDGNVFGKEPDWPLPPDDKLTAPRTSSSWPRAKETTILQAYIENARRDAEHIKQLTIKLDETRHELREAYGDASRARHDYSQLWLAHEKLRNDHTIDTQLTKLIPALAADPVQAAVELAPDASLPAADLLVQPQVDGSIRVALRGGSEPMRLHVGFQDGQTSSVSVSIGGN